MPVAYLDDCRTAAAVWTDEMACFAPANYFRIRKKYRGFSPSVATHQKGEPISGCCDRADQF
jgi:hypothetical protein